jgi:hypothetical protein
LTESKPHSRILRLEECEYAIDDTSTEKDGLEVELVVGT